jgi:hypothetical protein
MRLLWRRSDSGWVSPPGFESAVFQPPGAVQFAVDTHTRVANIVGQRGIRVGGTGIPLIWWIGPLILQALTAAGVAVAAYDV